MKTSIDELRYNMKEVLKALDRNESVQIFYRGKLKGIIQSPGTKPTMRVEEHPFFNMTPDGKSVCEVVDDLRGTQYS